LKERIFLLTAQPRLLEKEGNGLGLTRTNADFSRISADFGYVVAGFSPRSLSEHIVHKPAQTAG
jgi:hypothetical protein